VKLRPLFRFPPRPAGNPLGLNQLRRHSGTYAGKMRAERNVPPERARRDGHRGDGCRRRSGHGGFIPVVGGGCL